MLNFIAINAFLQPTINSLIAYPKDFGLLHGVLLSEVSGKHLEELALEHNLAHRSGTS